MRTASAFAGIERTVQTLAVCIGIATAVALPAGFGLVAYLSQLEMQSFQVALAAERVGQYAYIQGHTWRYSSHRLPELIHFPVDTQGNYKRVLDNFGKQLVTLGEPQKRPVLAAKAPILAGTETVGVVSVEQSLIPLLTYIALLSSFGAALGLSVYACVYYLPLRALRRTRESLSTTQDDLRAQVAKTESALAASRAQSQRAELASRTKSEFLANMSHELRTPLNAVIGFSEVMIKQLFGPLGDRYRSYAGDIHASGTHLLQIINDILDVSKIEAGKLKANLDEVNLATVADSCIALVKERAAEGGVKLVKAWTAAAFIEADVVKMKQILINLLSNAVKFTPPGGTVTLDIRSREAGWVEVGVSDTGIGMTPEDVKMAFVPFCQVDNSLTRTFSGTGLGVPLAQALCELHGGSLTFASELGQGTIATVRLPVRQAVPEDIAREAA